jgi:antitoxin MazE
METTIQKWGNSLGVRLPKELAHKKLLREGSAVVVHETSDGLLISPAKEPSMQLGDLVQRINPANVHAVSEWDAACGNEVW